MRIVYGLNWKVQQPLVKSKAALWIANSYNLAYTVKTYRDRIFGYKVAYQFCRTCGDHMNEKISRDVFTTVSRSSESTDFSGGKFSVLLRIIRARFAYTVPRLKKVKRIDWQEHINDETPIHTKWTVYQCNET